MGFFHLAHGVAITCHVVPRTLADAIDFLRATCRTRHAHAVRSIQRSPVGHPEISRSTLKYLELDRSRPNFLCPTYVVENPAVARLPRPRGIGPLAPLEFRPQIVILEFLFRDDVPDLSARNVNRAFLHTEDVVRIIVQSLIL